VVSGGAFLVEYPSAARIGLIDRRGNRHAVESWVTWDGIAQETAAISDEGQSRVTVMAAGRGMRGGRKLGRGKETGTREGNSDAISIDGNPLLRRPSKLIASWFPT
jgi:hypothetical protein